MNREPQEKNLTTADLADAGEIPAAQREVNRDLKKPIDKNQNSDVRSEDTQLAPLFLAGVAKEFHTRWDTVQIGFVDNPRQAVRQADELVAQVMKSLAETFSKERARLEGQLDQKDKASTETLRVALRRYRSFFERLLSL